MEIKKKERKKGRKEWKIGKKKERKKERKEMEEECRKREEGGRSGNGKEKEMERRGNGE